jgi:hypothetical protein
MGESLPIKTIRNEWGKFTLSDNTTIYFRVAVMDFKKITLPGPPGQDVEVNFSSGLVISPSPEVLEQIKDKPRANLQAPPPQNGWNPIDIANVEKPSIDIVECEDESIGTIIVTVELWPAMVYFNNEYSNVKGEPLYGVAWSPRISWRQKE